MHITPVGLGTWAIGGPWKYGWGSQDDKDSIKTIHTALDAGINWIDTAAVYGTGHAEEITGQVLKERSDAPLVFTKCSLVWDEKGDVTNKQKKESIQKEIEDSLRRLDVDVIDLYQVHWPFPADDIVEGWETMARIKESGKVRYIGLSNYSAEQMEELSKIAPITSLQPPYSLIRRDIEESVLPYCEKNDIGVIVYSPMASGLLSGKMTKERIAAMDDGDWRKKHRDFTEPKVNDNLALAGKLAEIGKKYKATAGEVAIVWTLAQAGVSGAIVGMRRPDQVEGVVGAGTIELSEEDLRTISESA